jgi:hypothetical protein
MKLTLNLPLTGGGFAILEVENPVEQFPRVRGLLIDMAKNILAEGEHEVPAVETISSDDVDEADVAEVATPAGDPMDAIRDLATEHGTAWLINALRGFDVKRVDQLSTEQMWALVEGSKNVE